MLNNCYFKTSNCIKGILIDIDNTLLDFEKSSQLAIIRTCEDFNLAYSEQMFEVFFKVNNEMWRQIQDNKLTKTQLWQNRWNKIFDTIGITADGPIFETEFHHNLQNCAIPINNALEVLKYLHSKYSVFTASNASYKQQYHRLKIAGMLKYIDKMFVSENLGAQKPNKDFFHACFKQIDFNPQNTLMIGDDLHADMLGASSYGIKTCWFNPRNLPNNEHIKLDITISNLIDIKQYI